MIDIQPLAILREIDRTGSLTRAADRMNLTQAAVHGAGEAQKIRSLCGEYPVPAAEPLLFHAGQFGSLDTLPVS